MKVLRSTAVALALLLSASGCASEKKIEKEGVKKIEVDTTGWSTFEHPQGLFRLKHPPGWMVKEYKAIGADVVSPKSDRPLGNFKIEIRLSRRPFAQYDPASKFQGFTSREITINGRRALVAVGGPDRAEYWIEWAPGVSLLAFIVSFDKFPPNQVIEQQPEFVLARRIVRTLDHS